jgi:hypothetical protein
VVVREMHSMDKKPTVLAESSETIHRVNVIYAFSYMNVNSHTMLLG